MSTRDTGTTPSEEKPKGLAKFKRRISKILGKDDVKRANLAAASGSVDPPTSVPAHAPTETTPPSKVIESGLTTDAKPIKVSIRPKSAKTAAENAQIQEEKARVLFAKYGLELEIGDWKPPVKSNIDRIEKPIRVRVHRTCHRCQTQYGVDNVCANCTHKRCKKCPRYPSAKKDLKSKESATPATVAYVKRPVTQRTRKLCHECKTPFKSKTSQCETCQHTRCALCTREAPRVSGIPGSAPSKAPRVSQTTWSCHACDNIHRDPEDPCLRCGHKKCEACPRDTIKSTLSPDAKTASPQSQDGVEGLEERMKGMEVSSQASAA